MNTCPKCGAKIGRLDWRQVTFGTLQENWHMQTSNTIKEYHCSECGVGLFSDKDNAAYFLESEQYPNNADTYKCNRCGIMTNRVYYHTWSVGDLCERCHQELKHLDVECRIEDKGIVDYVPKEILSDLWNIKMKSGTSIVEQILEAIEGYIDKHSWCTGNKDVPPINNRIKRFGK